MVEFGTGWLIGKQHLITCNHVLDARSAEESARAPISESDFNLQLQNSTIEFDYYEPGNSNTTLGKIEKLALSVPDLDFAILKLSEPIDREPLTLSPKGVNVSGEPVIIIQHPEGNVMQIAREQNNIHSIDNYRVKYFTDTLGGSSGAPVLNEKFEVVAMHNGTIDLTIRERVFLDGQIVKRINVGIRVGCIIDYLVKNHSELWEDMQATVK